MGALGAAELAVLALGAAAGLLLLVRVVKREPDPFIARVIVAGMFAKLAGSLARYTVMADVYDGRGDFNRYFERGRELAGVIRSGNLPDEARETGTPFMDFIAGVVYSVVPNRLWVGFAIFALLSFVGALLFLKAFQLAVPEAHHRRYALLVFFLPTMVFWPSSIGKEAWLVFSLGLATYGAARSLRRARYGYAIAALGGAGVFMVRPHMGAILGVAFAGAFLLRVSDNQVKRNSIGWLLGLVIVGLGAGYAAANFSEELPRDESVEGSTTDQVAAETTRRTTSGGSAFESRPVRTPVDFLHAAVTVPFRPFPPEAPNRQAQLASLEGLFFLVLIALSLPRLVDLPRLLLRRPYVAMAAAYSVGFIIAFSNVGNFGILVRQRAQLLPFLVVLLCLPRRTRTPMIGPSGQAPIQTETVVPPRRRPVLVRSLPTPVESAAAEDVSNSTRTGGPSGVRLTRQSGVRSE
jgi:hypothetical protein